MGKRREGRDVKQSQTLPPSPSHSYSSSSSSEFEFTVARSPQKALIQHLIPADELFYKGQLLPLHLSPRLSMVRTLLLASPSSSSSSDTTTTASRDSTASTHSNDSSTSSLASDLVLLCDSARPSSVTEEDGFIKFNISKPVQAQAQAQAQVQQLKKPSKYFSLSRFSSVFIRKDAKNSRDAEKSLKKVSTTKQVIKKYLKKVKPLYDKLSMQGLKSKIDIPKDITFSAAAAANPTKSSSGVFSNSFSGNLTYPRRRRCVSSCPSSMRSSPSHSYSLLPRNTNLQVTARPTHSSDLSSMEELQSAIQGAITHCKNSMVETTSSTWVS